MNWLKDHAFLASWLSPLIALIALITRSPKNKQTGEVEWLSIVLYIVLLTLLAASVAPGNTGGAIFARSTVVFVLIVILYRESSK